MKQGFTTNIKLGGLLDKATTQRKSGNFNSFCVMPDGTYLAAGEDGLCMLGGNTDNGVAIHGYFEPPMISVGEGKPTRNRHAFIEFSTLNADESIYLGYYPDNKLSEYAQKTFTSAREQNKEVMVALNNKIRGNRWSYRIGNLSGVYFIIRSFKITITRLASRHA